MTLLTIGTAVVVFSIVVWPIGSAVVWAFRKMESWRGRYY